MTPHTILSGVAVRSAAGFTACGDVALDLSTPDARLFLVADALGHGPDAETSARCVAATASTLAGAPLSELFTAVSQALVGVRGAVMSAIRVDAAGARFAGVGNVEIYGPPKASRPACVPGILGHHALRFREHVLALAPGERWALASDGLRAREVAKALAETRDLAPTEAAVRLIELVGRDDDDASVLVIDLPGGADGR